MLGEHDTQEVPVTYAEINLADKMGVIAAILTTLAPAECG